MRGGRASHEYILYLTAVIGEGREFLSPLRDKFLFYFGLTSRRCVLRSLPSTDCFYARDQLK